MLCRRARFGYGRAMMVRSGNLGTRLRMLASALLISVPRAAGPGWAQSTAPAPPLDLQESRLQAPPPQSTSSSSAPSAHEENPGPINEMGKLFDKRPSAKVLIPGGQREPDDCRTDTFVTSALCQN